MSLLESLNYSAKKKKYTYFFHRLNLHFDIWIRVSISIHGSQVNAAYDPHDEAILLGAVHEGHQNATALLCIRALLPWLRHSMGRT